MTIEEFIDQSTVASPTRTIRLGPLLRAFRDATGRKMPRAVAVAELVASGFSIAADRQGLAVLVGRGSPSARRLEVVDGVARRVPV